MPIQFTRSTRPHSPVLSINCETGLMREFAWAATYGWVAAPTGFLGGYIDHPFSRTTHESKPPTHTPSCWGSRMFGAIFPFSSIAHGGRNHPVRARFPGPQSPYQSTLVQINDHSCLPPSSWVYCPCAGIVSRQLLATIQSGGATPGRPTALRVSCNSASVVTL